MEQTTSKKVMDPVCGVMFEATEKPPVSSHEGKEYFFCGSSCKASFDRQPEKYLGKKGRFGLWLERVAKANEETFGSKPPRCCH